MKNSPYLCIVNLKPITMKRAFLFALFVSMVVVCGKGTPQVSAMPNDGDEIEFGEIIIIPKPGPKSIVAPLRAWYFQKPNMINLCPNNPQGLLMVTIEDGLGNFMLQQIVDGDQSAIKILLPVLQADYYKITIQSSTYLLAGWFEVQ